MVSHKLAASPRIRPQQERGQVIVLVVVMLIVMLGFAALVIDVGYAYYAHRSLQASTDAAALAGAQELPDAGPCQVRGTELRRATRREERADDVPGVATTMTTKCLAAMRGLQPGQRRHRPRAAAHPTSSPASSESTPSASR